MIFKNISMSNGPSEFSEVFNNTADTFALHRTWDNYDKEIYELKKDVVSAYSEYKRNGTAPSDEQMKIWELDMRIRKQSIDKELETVTNNKVKRSLQKQKASIDIALDTSQDIGVRLASIHNSYVTLGYMGYVRQRYHQKVSLETTIKAQDTDSIEWIVYEKIRKRKFFREATPDRQELIFKIAVDDYLSLLNEVNEFAKSEALSQIER